ncbi:MAG: carboxypeptidase-like regulatory domain-containing protein [Candidatus Marinimicrobia bacterium]|nr:carboxypeptidase-like regulatory domain-containing protein [Candidatus Neomarinimicrobiota bacterium]
MGRAETLSGRVLSSATGDAIPYVNIGVLKGERGTVSNDKGYFRLDLSEIDKGSTLRFSFIGYESYDVTIAEILERCKVACEVELTPKILELPEVVVYPRKFKEKVVGNPHPPPGLKAGFTNDSLGYELGILVKLKQRPTLLKELRLHGIETSFETIFYRLNVYEMDQDLPGKNVLSEPIYITLTNFSGEKIIKIDLSPHQIVVEDDFVISLEYVKELGAGNLVFATGILSGKMFYRKTSQAEWHSAPFGLGMSVLISYEK